MLTVQFSPQWHATFPGGHIGLLLVEDIDNSNRPTPLDDYKQKLEERLRTQYAGFSRVDLLELETLKAYRSYYKQFNKTYHVQLQLESVIFKGKSLPRVSPLVDAAFAAELETLILTASHDVDRLELPVSVDATRGGEQFVQMGGAEKELKPNDMLMRDARSVVCTILYGQDARTSITPATRRALYVAYVPPGIAAETVQNHLEILLNHVRRFAPNTQAAYLQVHTAEE